MPTGNDARLFYRPEFVIGTIAASSSAMITSKPINFRSLGDEISGALFTPTSAGPSPVLIICHGAGEFKENYFEMCDVLAGRGVASLVMDMHGHGESGGDRFCVRMNEWVSDIRAAI